VRSISFQLVSQRPAGLRLARIVRQALRGQDLVGERPEPRLLERRALYARAAVRERHVPSLVLIATRNVAKSRVRRIVGQPIGAD
jgi:hypothetical protein